MKPTLEAFVVVCFALLGFVGSVFLYFQRAPPIMIAFFLATGIAALVYKFLGGITESTSFAMGALKLSGTAAVLVGIAFLINNSLVQQLPFQVLSDDLIIGDWRWVYGSGGWDGRLHFTETNGQIQFTGEEFKVINETERQRLFTMTNGTARLVNTTELELEMDVFDHQHNDHFHWKGIAPFSIAPAFRGELHSTEPRLAGYQWGMLIYKIKPAD